MANEIDKKLLDKLRFAGVKVPSMKRRSNINNYYGRHIYMVTMAVEGRRPLLGTLTSSSTIVDGQSGAPCVVPTLLGQEVIRCWDLIPRRGINTLQWLKVARCWCRQLSRLVSGW